MGRGSSGAGGGGVSRNKEKGLNPGDIKSEKDMISEGGSYLDAVNEVMEVSKSIEDEYGFPNVANQFLLAELAPAASNVLGYYGNDRIAMNQVFMKNVDKTNKAYDECVEAGYHPSRGNKSGIQAVAAHEYGHALTDQIAKKMGGVSLDQAATNVVKEARKETKHRGVVQLANAISRYATTSNAEAIAEAFADVYCNGSSAKTESRAIMKVVNKYLK